MPISFHAAATRASRRLQFRGKHRLIRALGLDGDHVPDGVVWAEGVEGIRLRTASPQDLMFVEVYYDGYYQDDVLVALSSLLRPGDTFWDVGANYGFMSLYVDKKFGGSVETVCFEPSPVVGPFLAENLAENAAANVTVDPRVLSDSEGEVTFYFSDVNSWNATVIPDFAAQHGETLEVVVPSTTIDLAVGELPPPDVMKIDVEGAEHLVVRGGEQFLREHKPAIVAEYNLVALKLNGMTGDEYLQMFRDLGYRVYVMSAPWVGWHRWSTLHEVTSATELPDLSNVVLR